MEISKNSLATAFLVALAMIIPLSLAQNSPQDYIDAHNNARAQVGVGNMTGDRNLAAYACNYANQRAGDCNLVHSGGPYGENLAWSSGDLSGTDAVKMWVDEKANYDNISNSCVGGECRHYTQVVWRNSVRLGCAKARCSNGGTIISCNYDPPGNYEDTSQDYLNAHNAARAAVGVGPLTWDTTVKAYAQNYANQLAGDCNLVHSGGPYGENLAGSSGDLTGRDAVKLWVDEKPKYNYNSNSCVGGECRHYTQVVWRNSVRLGCAKARCSNGGTVISCNYDPPRKYGNQRPY